MRHSRPDYNRIQDPANIIPKDEPVFLLRGQDQHAAAVLRHYADLVAADGGDPEIVLQVREQADAMDAWPTKKSPDL